MQNAAACCELTRTTTGPLFRGFLCLRRTRKALRPARDTEPDVRGGDGCQESAAADVLRDASSGTSASELVVPTLLRVREPGPLFAHAGGARVQTGPAPQSAPNTGPERMHGMVIGAGGRASRALAFGLADASAVRGYGPRLRGVRQRARRGPRRRTDDEPGTGPDGARQEDQGIGTAR